MIDYDVCIERENTSYRISGVVSEENIEINNMPKNLSYIWSIRTGTGEKKVIYMHPHHECVETQI